MDHLRVPCKLHTAFQRMGAALNSGVYTSYVVYMSFARRDARPCRYSVDGACYQMNVRMGRGQYKPLTYGERAWAVCLRRWHVIFSGSSRKASKYGKS